MNLVIIAKDLSWKIVYETAKSMNKWQSIKVFYENNVDNYDSINISLTDFNSIEKDNIFLVIASYNPFIRDEEFNKWKGKGYKFATILDSDNFVFKDTKIGEGSIICKGVIIYPDSIIGENVLLMPYSSISHDFIVDKNSILMEKVTTGGRGKIGKNTYINSMAVIKENIIIGSNVFIDSGAVVLKNVNDNEKVRGNPARIIKPISKN